MDVGGLGGRKGRVSGCNRMDLSLTQARDSSSQEAGSFHILGATFHNVMGIPPPPREGEFRHKGWLGVGGYSLSARQGALTKETGGEWPRLVKAASMEAYDPRQLPHVPVPLCDANVEMALARLPVAAI